MSIRPDSSSASEKRKKSYNTEIDSQESQKRREENIVSIRRNRRQCTLIKKRREAHVLLQAVQAMVERLCYEYPPALLVAPDHVRTLLTLAGKCFPVDVVVGEGIVPRFVKLLSRDDAPQLQLGALMILTNITCGTLHHKRVIVEHGVVPYLVNILSSSSNDDIKEETVCALGSVVIDSPSYRDLVLNNGALSPLLYQLEPPSRLSMVRLATWCLSNLVHGYPPVNFEQVKPALPILQRLIIHGTDEEVVTDACWALSYLSEISIEKIQDIIEAEVCPKLVKLLQYPSDTVVLPALLILGNIVTGDDAQTQLVIDNGLLPCLHQLLTRKYKKSIFKEACWTISNIAAGNGAQIQAVIDANIIPPLVKILQHCEFDIKTEAAWAIYNVTNGGSHDNIRYVAAQSCIKPLCELLTCPDLMVVSICLEALENILMVGEADKEMGLHDRVNVFAQMVDKCKGLDKIEKLLSHDNDDILKIASRIVKRFWRPENDVEDILDLQIAGDGSQQPDLPPSGFNSGS